MKPEVTIYICSHNYGQFLDQSITSALQQSYQNIKIFLVNEGSDDNTFEIIKKYKEKYPNKITTIDNKNAIGLQKVTNQILSQINSDFIFRLDADDWLTADAIEKLVLRSEEIEDTSIIYGDYYYTDVSGNILGEESQKYYIKKKDFFGLMPHGACCLINVKKFKAMGGYNIEYKAQDGWDLWLNLDRNDYESVDSKIFFYRQHGKSLSVNLEKISNQRNKILLDYARKNCIEDIYKIGVIPISIDNIITRSLLNSNNFQNYLADMLLETSSCSCLDIIYISVDSAEIYELITKELPLKANHKVLLRSSNADHNVVPVNEILKECIEDLKTSDSKQMSMCAFLNFHSPKRKSTDIENAFTTLFASRCDGIVSVTRERQPLFSLSSNQLNLISGGKFSNLFHFKKSIFVHNGSVMCFRSSAIQNRDLFDGKLGFIEMSKESGLTLETAKDINEYFNQK